MDKKTTLEGSGVVLQPTQNHITLPANREATLPRINERLKDKWMGRHPTGRTEGKGQKMAGPNRRNAKIQN